MREREGGREGERERERDLFSDFLHSQAVEFLYDKGFPTSAVGHIQSGNIFVVDDVCKLGGYENTLLGYKTRIYRICKDHLDHFDTILFGKCHNIVEGSFFLIIGKL